jgi:hypothetical protein
LLFHDRDCFGWLDYRSASGLFTCSLPSELASQSSFQR